MKVFISSAVATAALAASPAMAALPSTVTALIDSSINPCEDFYQYSCGSWLKTHPLGPSDTSNDASFSTISDRNELVIQDIVKQDWPLIGEFWDSCLDTTTQDALGAKPLQAFLNKISTAASKKDVLRLAGELSRSGANFITSFDVAGDYKDAKNNVMYVGAADLVLPDMGIYFDDEAFADLEPDYRKYITSVMTMSGYNANGGSQQSGQGGAPVSATYFADAVIAVEKKLIEVQSKVKEQTGEDAYYIPTKVGDAIAKFPLTIGAYLTGAGLLDATKTSITKETKSIFSYLDYFQLAEAALGEMPIKDIKTYVAFLYVNNRVRYLNNAFYQAYFDFFANRINGQKVRSPTASICVYRVQQYFPDLIGKYYFMKMFSQELEDNTQMMTKMIESAMGDHIAKLTWLDSVTREEAAGKLAKVANLIGQSKVKQSYPFSMDRAKYFNNVDLAIGNTFDLKIKEIGKPVNRDLWSMSAATVNAYYSPLENKMVFPAAILQPPFFNGTAHPAQNFGSIGAVIGHELTHGFDSSGRNFDGDGNRRNWWQKSTADEFEKRATCMKDQYSSFNVTGENGKIIANINGETTIGENTADNGGFSLSWDAYHAYAATPNFDSKGLSSEEGDKLMFLSFAQTWCGLSRDGAMLSQLKTDPHSPGQWRANGVAMNSDHFGKTFKCDVGTPMNPEKKCQIW